MDPQLCRKQLEKLLADENAILADLEQLLMAEHGILLKNELTALEAASDARQQRMGALLSIQDERRSLLHMHGFETDPQGINKLLAWCDPRRTLAASWAQCRKFAERCRLLNDRNAALVAARMKRVQGLLDVIVGPGKQANVYSAGGTRDAARCGVMFTTEA